MASKEYPTYLDGHSTTPLAHEALEAMAPWWHKDVGNPHSPHLAGMRAFVAVEAARENIARIIGAVPPEVVLTSGATEANNIALLGVAAAAKRLGSERRRIVVSALEHKSVLEAAQSLKRDGFEILVAPALTDGVIDIEAFASTMSDEVLLVSVMAVNNELGTIQPTSSVVALARSVGALVHVDCAQAIGKIEVDVSEYDFASISSHKMYGPAGIGALFVSSAATIRPEPISFGGSQEMSLRPGTVPTPLVVGFGAAAQLVGRRLQADRDHSNALQKIFFNQLEEGQVEFVETTPRSGRVPGSISLRFPGHDAMSVIARVANAISISEGSACSSGQIDYSHVLKSIGLDRTSALETLRMYFSRYNVEADAVAAARALVATLN